ncbi:MULTISPECIES: hypothetical protein [unclassified Methanosarcina]|uniref:hypothetical protein n=1 Tax=unclassified Methanosarcina TaxID=2644672 RepID=UPI000615DD7C|nr:MULTISPECIES: hypothetical protein [unclassified Methanosarcina]AKB18281.1 hypothetical protein MSWHS_1418 [Methanosarcina sp. WWM596]AKB21605.1 hypothetical protein MSWH1_1334 [Methanosarcina sp. WH1]
MHIFDEDLILKWLDEGTIDNAQAEKMREELAEYKGERGSGKQIVVFSIIEVILLGLVSSCL